MARVLAGQTVASGAYDRLSGRYLIPEDDVDELLRQIHST